jgi:hypothetical protein
VRRVMGLYETKAAVRLKEGRKQPIGYILSKGMHRSLALVGHYETDCGGCDTIANMDEIYANVRQASFAEMDVLFEGLLISADANRIIKLWEDLFTHTSVRVIALNTPLELCLESVNHRRRNAAMVKGRDYKGDVNPKNTTSKFTGVKSSMKRIEAAGVPCSWESRDSAFELIKREFKL